MARKVSAARQADINRLRAIDRERLAYHHVLTASLAGELQRVGSVYHDGDSYVWQLAFTPRLRDAVIVQTFQSSHSKQGASVRVFYLEDQRDGFSMAFDPGSESAKLQELYWQAERMERAEQAAPRPDGGEHFDYVHQAWTIDGKYVRCGHPDTISCRCYGREHAGETANPNDLPTS